MTLVWPRSIVISIFGGDFCHNFVDGIFIANAFLDCSAAKGWTITFATVLHEFAQEISDFFLLISQGHMTTVGALLVNVASGTSVMLGAAMFMLTKPGPGTRGLMLAFSAGIYIFVAATEAAAHFLHSSRHSNKLSAAIFASFVRLSVSTVTLEKVLGAVCIGLVLLDHGHCEADDGGGGGGGDGHGH